MTSRRPGGDPGVRDGRPRIAVVGSGLAGLATAWLLGRRARVVVHEAHGAPGLGAHSLDADGETGPRIDVPLRVFTPGYYPTLLALFREAGVEVAGVDYAASFSHLAGSTYFRYRNVRVGGRSIPLPVPSLSLGRTGRRIVADALRLHLSAPAHLRSGALEGRTVADYLEGEGYSAPFVDGFLVPAYASICTCRSETLLRYPARPIVEYICSGVLTLGVARAVGGTRDVARRLLSRAAEVRLGTPVRRVLRRGDTVEVEDEAGRSEPFDHVVLATRADQALDLLEGNGALRGLLARIPHERSRVTVHRDPRLAPRERRHWSPVNFLVSEARSRPMATIWLNRVQTGLEPDPPLFQSWNPLVEPDPSTVLAEAWFERPVVTLDSQEVPRRLAELHADPGRRVWTVGSYAEPGVPLLESAAASAFRVARSLAASGPARV